MDTLPTDINMLLSYINMKLRDEYNSLDDLCQSLDIPKANLIDKLRKAGFEYNPQQNRFW